MEKLVYLDTHAVVWLYAGELSLFPKEARRLMEDKPLVISPIVLLELQYLLEIGKIKTGPDKILKYLEKNIGLKVCRLEFYKIIAQAISQDWTRDPFDRLIVAHASIAGAVLISKDESVGKHYPQALWR